MRSSLRAGVWLAIGVGGSMGCSAGAPPWPSAGGDAAGASSTSPLADGSAGATSSSAGAAGSSVEPANAGSNDAGPLGGSGGAGSGGPNASEGPPVGAPVDMPPGGDASGTPPQGQLCQQSLPAAIEPPSVVVVVDRTGSMFSLSAETGVAPWTELRTTVLAAIDALDGEARFGFLVYSGDSELCPELTALPPALDNQAPIAALYGSLEVAQRRDGGPVAALSEAASMLARVGGDPHVWLVTDGEVDYCDDGNPICPVDSAIAAVQRLAAATPPIRTTVFGSSATPSTFLDSTLQSLANAGAAQPVARPASGPTPTDVNAIFDQCSGVTGWASDFSSTGKPIIRGQSIADYAEISGSAVAHAPVGGDVDALVAELRAGFVGERRCAFDLAAEGVTASALATLDANAVLEIDGAPVANDAANGWHLVAGSTLRLEGAACAAVQSAVGLPQIQVHWACTP